MRDLRHRLSLLGHRIEEDGPYGLATEAAVRAFQQQRGLPASGTCDQTTWDALVEAGWRLGDRPLYATAPMLRGDDVADLQRRLGALGFDAGRVDGIFGPNTDRALIDFQRNAGLVTDAICGPATVAALARLGNRGEAAIVDVREREHFRCSPKTLAGRTVAIAHAGGLDALATSIARAVRSTGARAFVLEHPDGSAQAGQANDIEADVVVAVVLASERQLTATSFYRSPAGWESAAGRALAHLLHDRLGDLLPTTDAPTPMSVPVLRETRMPAVLVELGPAPLVVERTAAVAAALPDALQRWLTAFGSDAP